MHFIIRIKQPMALYYIVTHTQTCVCVCVCVCHMVTSQLQLLITWSIDSNCMFDRIIYLTYAVKLTSQMASLVGRAD
jgi:hypothetical protein